MFQYIIVVLISNRTLETNHRRLLQVLMIQRHQTKRLMETKTFKTNYYFLHITICCVDRKIIPVHTKNQEKFSLLTYINLTHKKT